MRWSCQGEKAWVPVAPSAKPCARAWANRARRGDLDLARDQLAEDALAQAGGGAVAQQLETGHETERVRVEDLVLLLEPDREVGRRGEEFLDPVEVGADVGVGGHCRPSIPAP